MYERILLEIAVSVSHKEYQVVWIGTVSIDFIPFTIFFWFNRTKLVYLTTKPFESNNKQNIS